MKRIGGYMGEPTRWRLLLFPVLLLALLACSPPQLEQEPPVHLVVTVRDELTRQPLPGAECRLPEQLVQSDSGGQCRFIDWTTAVSLSVSAAGYQPGEISLAGLEPGPDTLEVKVEVALLPDHAEGMVLDAYTGEPIAGADVHSQQETLRTDAQGKFALQSPLFPIELAVWAGGYEAWEGSFSDTAMRVSLRPNTLDGVVFDLYEGTPLAGAQVTLTGSAVLTATTGEDGRYHLAGVPERYVLAVGAPLYHPEQVNLERTTQHEISLRPAFLRGLVRDGRDGQPLALARVVWEGRYVHTDEQGRFFLEEVPEEVFLQVLSPGFAKQVVTVTGSASVTVDLEPFAVQGIYITSFVASTTDWFTQLLDYVAETELNAVVIEAKDAFGAVTYDSQIPLVQELDTASPRYNVPEVLRMCRERGIYTIAYIVTFEDSRLADARPEWAIQSVSRNGAWQDRKGLRWTDPYIQDVWEYNISIATELANLGFDEIQFDYIRFPTDGSISDIVYAEETSIEKQYETIAAFLERAYEELGPTGAFISADVFGYAAWRKMWEQGQDLSLMTHYLDYISPMSYPSHYSPGELGCANPNTCPYEIVLETVLRAYSQMTGGQRAKVRPWLQDFDLGSPPYGPAEVEAEIRASWDAGGVGWLLWNAGNQYTTGLDYSP